MSRLLIMGLGYSGRAIAEAALTAGFSVAGTTRRSIGEATRSHPASTEVAAKQRKDIVERAGTDPIHPEAAAVAGASPQPAPRSAAPRQGVEIIAFDAAEAAIETATHLIATAAPEEAGDPVLARYAAAIAAAPALRWIGYLSSTVVYGDRGGNWVDEDTPPAPSQPRGARRLAAEAAWTRLADQRSLDIFRLAGIYGPDRSAFDDLREGRARRMIKPGHQFGRIHRDDIARAVVAAMQQDRPRGVRILNLADDEPAESASVLAEAACLFGVDPPEEIAYEVALPAMTPMARSFWAENRKVSAAKTKTILGIEWLYPTYREGLRAILKEQGADGLA